VDQGGRIQVLGQSQALGSVATVAQLPPDGEWLIQQIGGVVIVFNRYTEEEVVSFNPSDADASAKAQKVIFDSDILNPEQKCFAHFWCGYFHAHATHANNY